VEILHDSDEKKCVTLVYMVAHKTCGSLTVMVSPISLHRFEYFCIIWTRNPIHL